MSTFKYLNLDYLNLMADGDDDMKATMIEMLVEELPEVMDKMKTAHEVADWNELREVSHKMKSTLAFVGNDAMTEANKEVEDIAKNGGDNAVKLPELLGILFDIYPKALEELKTVLSSIEV